MNGFRYGWFRAVPLVAAACVAAGAPAAGAGGNAGVVRTGCIEQLWSTEVTAAAARAAVPANYTPALSPTGGAKLSVVTSSCRSGGRLVFAGIAVTDPAPGTTPPDDPTDPRATPGALRYMHHYLLWSYADDRRLVRTLKAAKAPVVAPAGLSSADNCAEGTPSPVLCDVETASTAGDKAFRLTVAPGAVLTPPHRHDYLWWHGSGTDRRRVRAAHAFTVETASLVRFDATGAAWRRVLPQQQVSGYGFVQGPVEQRTRVERI